MSIREDIERMECETLSPYATLSIHSSCLLYTSDAADEL